MHIALQEAVLTKKILATMDHMKRMAPGSDGLGVA